MSSADSSFPLPGECVLHFDLVEELGRGAFARVYLAKQESLANRFVALKITTTPTDEPQKLARLQHPNVVPVYSVHQDGYFQVLCMPYLGRVTLARVINHLTAKHEKPPQMGSALLTDLIPGCLAHAECSYVEAVLRLVEQLTAGLAHAHGRGILHRDLKPANVLVTSDGVPMLLDFNVSSESAHGDHHPQQGGRVGGTLPYMAPEHLRAFAGEDALVDERSDLYSLGVILYELLTGRLPHPLATGSSSLLIVNRMLEQRRKLPDGLRAVNPAVSPATEAIVLKLLAPNPADRYQSADNLRDDIARQISHQPLKFAPNPSFKERARKWRRRNPRLAATLAVSAAAFLFLLLPAGAVLARQQQLAARAQEVQRAEAVNAARQAAADIETAAIVLTSQAETTERERGRQLAIEVFDRYGIANNPDWEHSPLYVLLEPAEQRRLRQSIAEMFLLLTPYEAQRGNYSPDALRAALRWNELAQQLFGDEVRPVVLQKQRAELEARLNGQPLPPFAASNPDTASDMDLYFDGVTLLGRYQFSEAVVLLARFTERQPSHFRGWFARGYCHSMLGQPDDTAAAFGACLALRADFPQAHLNRGLARYKQRRFPEAEREFTRALALKPNWELALLYRGLARDEQKKFAEAEADYTAALELPNAQTRLHFLRADSRRELKNPAGEKSDRHEGMTRQPADAISYATRGKKFMDANKAKEALADFDAALKLHPVMRDALLNKAIVLGDFLKREADAIPVLDRLLEVYPSDIEACAGRGVYFARLGRAAEAMKDAEETLRVDQSAFRLYQMAGLYALLSKTEPKQKAPALQLFARSLRAGFDKWKIVDSDADIEPIRNDPEFLRLRNAASQLDRAR